MRDQGKGLWIRLLLEQHSQRRDADQIGRGSVPRQLPVEHALHVRDVEDAEDVGPELALLKELALVAMERTFGARLVAHGELAARAEEGVVDFLEALQTSGRGSCVRPDDRRFFGKDQFAGSNVARGNHVPEKF